MWFFCRASYSVFIACVHSKLWRACVIVDGSFWVKSEVATFSEIHTLGLKTPSLDLVCIECSFKGSGGLCKSCLGKVTIKLGALSDIGFIVLCGVGSIECWESEDIEFNDVLLEGFSIGEFVCVEELGKDREGNFEIGDEIWDGEEKEDEEIWRGNVYWLEVSCMCVFKGEIYIILGGITAGWLYEFVIVKWSGWYCLTVFGDGVSCWLKGNKFSLKITCLETYTLPVDLSRQR